MTISSSPISGAPISSLSLSAGSIVETTLARLLNDQTLHRVYLVEIDNPVYGIQRFSTCGYNSDTYPFAG